MFFLIKSVFLFFSFFFASGRNFSNKLAKFASSLFDSQRLTSFENVKIID